MPLVPGKGDICPIKKFKKCYIIKVSDSLDAQDECIRHATKAYKEGRHVEDNLLTAAQVAGILKLDINTVGQYLRDGRILGKKVGRTWRVRNNDLQSYVNRKQLARQQAKENSLFFREQFAQFYYGL